MGKPTVVMFAATVVGGACNYLYQILMGRTLGTADYSELSALLSILYIVAIPSSAVQTVLIRYVSKYKALGIEGAISWLMRRTLLIMTIFAVASIAVLLLLGPFLIDFLSLTAAMPLIILSLGIALSFISPVGTGPLQGLQRFLMFGVQGVAGALAKLVMAVVLVMAGFGVGGAVGGITIGTALTLLLAIFPLRRYLTQRGTAADTREIYKYLVPVAVAVLCSAVLTNIDVIFARHYLDFHEAGLYSAASMISKIILFLPSAIAIVLFPKVSDAHARTAETHRILRTSIIITLLLSSLIALAYVLVPDSIMGLLYGAEYSGSGPILQILGLAMVFFGISNLFMIYGLATDGRPYIWILALFSGLEVVLILLFHDAPGTIALNLLVVSVAITVISAVYLEYKVHGQSISPFKR